LRKLTLTYSTNREPEPLFNNSFDRENALLPNDKVKVIKALRMLTGIGLKEAKELSETMRSNTPLILKIDDERWEKGYNVEAIIASFKEIGFTVERVGNETGKHLRAAARTAIDEGHFRLSRDILDLLLELEE